MAACSADSTTQPAPVATSAAASAGPTATTSVAQGAPTPSASASPVPTTPARALYFDRAITSEDLEGRTLRELSLMRNTIFARAGNPFRRPWLNEYFGAQPWYAPKEKMDESKISDLDKANARLIADFDAAVPREALEKMRDAAIARKSAGTATAEDAVELSLLSQRLGVYVGGDERPSALEDPSRLDQLLSVDELSTLSRRDLRILRNTIYARKGRDFDSKIVKSYFASAAWYKPRADYSESLLSEVDRKNVTIIGSVEESLGGPLHENPDYVKRKNDWMSGA